MGKVENLFLQVPIEHVFEEDNKTLIFDFKRERRIYCSNRGKGGFGNTRFKSQLVELQKSLQRNLW